MEGGLCHCRHAIGAQPSGCRSSEYAAVPGDFDAPLELPVVCSLKAALLWRGDAHASHGGSNRIYPRVERGQRLGE